MSIELQDNVVDTGSGGGSVSVGNEAAIDLLQQINESKKVLAGNLEGLGITASASGNTLEELATKVADVVVDNERQKIPALLMFGTLTAVEVSPIRVLGNTGWLYHRYNSKVYFFKISSFFDKENYPNNNNGSNNFDLLEKFFIDNNPVQDNSITFNKDFSKCYIYTTTALYIYSIDYENQTTTLLKTINYSSFQNSYLLSVNDNETYAITMRNNAVYILDLSTEDGETGTWTQIFNGSSTGNNLMMTFVGNNNIIILQSNNNTSIIAVHHYTIDFATMTLTEVFTTSFDIENRENNFNTSSSFPFATLEINNKTYLFIRGSRNWLYPALYLYNVTDKIFTPIYSTTISANSNPSAWKTNRAINVQQINGKYVVFSGVGLCPIYFDANLNVIQQAVVLYYPYNTGSNMLLSPDGNVMAEIGNAVFYKQKIYNNKRCLYARTLTKVVDEVETTKTMYFPVKCEEQDVIDGFLDEE